MKKITKTALLGLVSILVLSSFSMAFTRIPPPIPIDWVDFSESIVNENNGGVGKNLGINLEIYGWLEEYELCATLYGPNEEYISTLLI